MKQKGIKKNLLYGGSNNQKVQQTTAKMQTEKRIYRTFPHLLQCHKDQKEER